MIFCSLGVHRRRKLFNIGEGEGSGMSSEVNFNAWGRVHCKTYIHACMHTYIHIYTTRSTSMLGAACALKTYIHACMHTYIHMWMHQ